MAVVVIVVLGLVMGPRRWGGGEGYLCFFVFFVVLEKILRLGVFGAGSTNKGIWRNVGSV